MNEISRIDPSEQQLLNAFRYDPEAGIFTRAIALGRHGCFPKGTLAGSVLPNGYRIIRSYGKSYYCHRLAWLFTHGVWPVGQIDHIDCNRLNNAINNLRLATAAQNAWNGRARTKRADGLKGIYLHKASGLWAATIMTNGVKRSLGYHHTAEAAHAAYAAAAATDHGEFARAA